jgi:hypothetical protein
MATGVRRESQISLKLEVSRAGFVVRAFQGA